MAKAKKIMLDRKGFSLDNHSARPRDGAKDAWWYEDTKGIEVYIENTDGVTLHASIDWKTLRQYVKRKQARDRKVAKK